METVHNMPKVCYNAGDEEGKNLAKVMLDEMDKNGDGNASLNEFMVYICKFFGEAKCSKALKMFQVLDVDESGSLDFWEAVTFYYTMQNNLAHCFGCGTVLFDAHFICACCFGAKYSYGLCVDCYGTSSYEHMNHHNCDGPANFVSNNSLLWIVLSQLEQQVVQESPTIKGSKWRRRSGAAKQVAQKVAVQVVNAACSIM